MAAKNELAEVKAEGTGNADALMSKLIECEKKVGGIGQSRGRQCHAARQWTASRENMSGVIDDKACKGGGISQGRKVWRVARLHCLR